MFFIILLIVVTIFFVIFPFIYRKWEKKYFSKLICNRINKFCKKHNLISYQNIQLNSEKNQMNIDNIVFGNKYIYLFNNIYDEGIITGNINDNSWIHINKRNRTCNYFSNLITRGKNISHEFSKKFKIDENLIVVNFVTNSFTDFQIKPNQNSIIDRHYVAKILKKNENNHVSSIDKDCLRAVIEEIKFRNEETRKYKINL